MEEATKGKNPNVSREEAAAKSRRRASGPKGGSTKRASKGAKRKELGRRGENAAARYLERRGYDILFRNWKCQAGEADIIAADGGCLVFVEVKTRSDMDKGLPEEAVDAAKRQRYEKIAAHFLKEHDYFDTPFRFDVVALLVVAEDRAIVRHHINAFGFE